MPALSTPPFATCAMKVSLGVGTYATANPGGEPGPTSGVWGMGIAFYDELNYKGNVRIINARTDYGTKGWMWYVSGSAQMVFYVISGSGSWVASPVFNLQNGYVGNRQDVVVVAVAIVNLTSNYLELWVDKKKLGRVSLTGFTPHPGAEYLSSLDGSPNYPSESMAPITRWSFSGLPSDTDIEAQFDAVFRYGGCPASLPGVTLRSRYNLNQDYSRELVSGAIPQSPAVIQDQVGTQHFTRSAGAQGPAVKLRRPYPATGIVSGQGLSGPGWHFYYVDKTVAQLDAWITASAPFCRFKASNYTQVGGKVTQFTDLINGSYALVQPNAAYQVPTPTADAGLNGALVASFNGSMIYQSNRPAANWKFLTDATGVSFCFVCRVMNTNSGNLEQFIASTAAGANPRFTLQAIDSGGNYWASACITNDSGQETTYDTFYVGLGSGVFLVGGHSNRGSLYGHMEFYGAARTDGQGGPTTGTSSTAAPSQALMLGGPGPSNVPGANCFVGNWAELIIWNQRLYFDDFMAIRDYVCRTYNIGG